MSIDLGLLTGLCTLGLGLLHVVVLVSRNQSRIALLNYRVDVLETRVAEMIDRLHNRSSE